MSKQWGATPDDWFLFSTILGLQEDLIPVVSNQDATISPNSKMGGIGKTPSIYNKNRQVVGIPDWTKHSSTSEDIDRWSLEPDYGICVISRQVKAIDIDIEDETHAGLIWATVREILGDLPARHRINSNKVLLAFRCPEHTLKRVIRTEHGIIEFLGDRQQFVAVGTHTSGERYINDFKRGIPDISLAQFDKLWAELQRRFGVEPEVRERAAKAPELNIEEPIYEALLDKGLVKSEGRDGSINITCPFEHEHTTEGAESATVYWPAHTGGFANPSIKCLHAHCSHRNTQDFAEALGISVIDDFEDISDQEFTPKPVVNASKFVFEEALDIAYSGGSPEWVIKKLLPKNAIGSVYGPSGSGKTFIVFDMIAAIARGIDWRDRKVKQGRGAYVCAEGAYFFRNRIRAYAEKHGITDKADLPISVLDGRPNLMNKQECVDLVAAIRTLSEPISILVIDTYANCMSGDENSSVDTNKMLNNCKYIRQQLSCIVLLVHHSGKDLNRGARGHSSMRAAMDFELQVVSEGGRHAMVVTKQKDGPDNAEFGFGLEEITLGVDEDLEPITSCVVVPSDLMPLVANDGERVGSRESEVYNEVQNYYEEVDEWPTEDELIIKAHENTGSRKADLTNALKKLIHRGKLVVENGYVKLTPAS